MISVCWIASLLATIGVVGLSSHTCYRTCRSCALKQHRAHTSKYGIFCLMRWEGAPLGPTGSVTTVALQVSMHMMSMTKQEGPAPNRASYAIPTDSIAFEQWQLYTTFLMASEPYPNVRRPANVRSADELLTHLLSVLRGGIEVHMQAATAALGACHQANLQVVLQV